MDGRLREFYITKHFRYSCCLPLRPQFARSILAIWEALFRRPATSLLLGLHFGDSPSSHPARRFHLHMAQSRLFLLRGLLWWRSVNRLRTRMRLPKEGAFDIYTQILSRLIDTNAILRRWWILRGEKSRGGHGHQRHRSHPPPLQRDRCSFLLAHNEELSVERGNR